MPRDMIENESGSAINPSEAVEEKVSLSDRFGLWLGFHPCSQEEFLLMVEGYCKRYDIEIEKTDERLSSREAKERLENIQMGIKDSNNKHSISAQIILEDWFRSNR